MSDRSYVRIRSWHIVLTPTRAINTYRTLCNRNGQGPTVSDLPLDEKSCETCLRMARRQDDQSA